MKSLIIIPAVFMMSMAQTAVAVDFETQVTSGRRWAETKTEGETAGTQISEYNIAGYGFFHPNVGVGPVMTYQQVRDVDLAEDTKASFFKAGVEAYGRYDLGNGLTPYGKLRYSLYSQGQAETDGDGFKASTEMETSGMNVTAGMKYNITDTFHVLGETGMGVEMIRTTSTEAELPDGTKLEDNEASGNDDFNSKFVLLGVGMQF